MDVYDSLLEPPLETSIEVDKENANPNNNYAPEFFYQKNVKHIFNIKKDLFLRFKEKHVSVMGTRFYRAPETLLLLKQDIRSEIWSLGCICLEVLRFCVFAADLSKKSEKSSIYPFALKKLRHRGPVFRGRTCELFSYTRPRNLDSIQKFRNLIATFTELNQRFLANESMLKTKHRFGMPKTDPRSVKKCFQRGEQTSNISQGPASS